MDDIPQESANLSLPPLIRLRVAMQGLDPIHLPPFAGSAWRGLLGHGLRQAACVTRARDCDGCLLQAHCVYPRVFEPLPPPGEDGRRFAAPPRPYLLNIDPQAGRDHAAGETLTLGITLLGEAIRQVPYLIHALQLAGQRGLGRAQARFSVTRLEQETAPGSGTWQPVYEVAHGRFTPLPLAAPQVPASPDGAVRLRLLTPLRLKRQGALVGPTQFSPRELVFNLYGRLRLLAEHHGDAAGFPEREALLAAAATLILSDGQLRWHEWTRFSSRQHTLMELGGLLGEGTLSGPGLPNLWPLLWLGQWVHAGKNTTFGLGAYHLAADPAMP